MNNEEKALEIAVGTVSEKTRNHPSNLPHIIIVKDACIEMAQWKDEQFENKLQEIVDYVYPLICGGERLHINEIIGKDMKWKHK